MESDSGICARPVLIDARQHMLDRLASIVAKELLNDQKELEKREKRKDGAREVYGRKEELTKLRLKAEKSAEEKLGSQSDVLAPVKY